MRSKKDIEHRLALLEDSTEPGADTRAEELRWVLGPKNAKSTRGTLEGEQLDLVDPGRKKKVYFKK